jgi:hypothetical protein
MKIRTNFHFFLKYYQFIVGGFILFILILVSLFLYKNFYRTITHAEEISRLQTEVAQQRVDKVLFEKVMNLLKARKRKIDVDWGSLKNPF